MIPGLGTSVRPALLDESFIDDVVWVEEADTVRTCHRMARRGFLFGGSTGTVVSGALAWLAEHDPYDRLTAVAIAPDLGERYLDTALPDQLGAGPLRRRRARPRRAGDRLAGGLIMTHHCPSHRPMHPPVSPAEPTAAAGGRPAAVDPRPAAARSRTDERLDGLFEQRCGPARAAGSCRGRRRPALTYGQLDATGANRAGPLPADARRRSGRPARVLFDQSVAGYIGMLAVLKISAGCRWTGRPGRARGDIVADAGATLVLTTPACGSVPPGSSPRRARRAESTSTTRPG